MRLLVPFALLLVVLGVVVAVDDPPPRGDLIVANGSDVFTLDPQRMSWLHDFRIAHAVYEGLARWNNQHDRMEPAAAASWTRSDDGLTYRFTLRTDARWTNGDPLTAHDFVYAWHRAMLPDTAADYSNLFFLIEGARDAFAWRAERLAGWSAEQAGRTAEQRHRAATLLWTRTQHHLDERVGVRALSDHLLEVRLEAPTAYFLDLVGFPVFFPVHPATVEAFADLDTQTARLQQRSGWTKPERLVSNGPLRVRAWRYKRGLWLEPNPLYHSPELVRSGTVECRTIEDPNTAVLAFESGAVDWVAGVSAPYRVEMLDERNTYIEHHGIEYETMLAAGRSPQEAISALPAPRRNERRNIHAHPAFGIDFFSFNCRAKLLDGRANPFADPRVRRAFVQAVDRRRIVERVTRLGEPVLTTIVPTGSIAGYRHPEGLDHDVEAARRALADAGWIDRGDGRLTHADGLPFPTVDLLYSTNAPRYEDMALALRDMWQRELGVLVELRGKESKLFKEDLKSGDFMIGRGNWYGDYGDPSTFLELFRSGDGNNDRGYDDPVVDGLLDEAAAQLDEAARFRVLERCETRLFRETLPMLVLCQKVEVYLYDPTRLRGLSTHPRLTQYLWQMEAIDR